MARSATSRKPSGDTVPCLVAIATAKAELQSLIAANGALLADEEESGGADEEEGPEEGSPEAELMAKKKELMQIIATGGRDPSKPAWTGPKVRVYFPDEGNAALARRDWGLGDPNPDKALVPPCVEFSSCGGVQMQDISDDMLVFFFCPRASEAESVEEILYKHEAENAAVQQEVLGAAMDEATGGAHIVAMREQEERAHAEECEKWKTDISTLKDQLEIDCGWRAWNQAGTTAS